MDYRMDDTPAHLYPVSPNAGGHTNSSSRRTSRASSLRREFDVAPSSSGQQIKSPENPDPPVRKVIVVEPPSPQQLPAQASENLESSAPDPESGQEQVGWDFVLPFIPAPASLTPGPGGASGFNITTIVGALQHGADEQVVQTYFNYFNPMIIEQHINDSIAGVPAIFFAAATNNDRILRAFIAFGGDINAVHEPSQVPLIAFAIAHSETIEKDTSDIVATLLSMGATPRAIPEAFYVPYFRDLAEEGPSDEELKDVATSTMRWLNKEARAKLARTVHLTNRYNLERALKTKRPSARHWQIAQPQQVLSELLSNLAVPSKRPLVLVFAGPSGHGKTEMARRLGYLMNLQPLVVDCTIVKREIELFGGRDPYINAARGTPLNNHLAKYHGERSIVFLDEFEKTSSEVHQALLLPFDNGEYQDRRNGDKIDCSKTIWVIATNALDDKIRNFCQEHGATIWNGDDEVKQARLMKALSKELKEGFLSHFSAPVTGRISAFMPFLLFSPGEQAAIAHKYLLELGRKVRDPVKLSADSEERFVGNVRLHIHRDASISTSFTESELKMATQTVSIPKEQLAAVRVGGGDSATAPLKTVPVTLPGPGEILVKINWTGLCASDKSLIHDEWAGFGVSMQPDANGIAGHEGAGTVVAVGEGEEDRWKVGDRAGVKWIASTCGTCEFCTNGVDECHCPTQKNSGFTIAGTFQQYCLASGRYTTRIPEGVTDEEAGPIMCGGVTAYTACKRSNVRPGQWIVLPGAGGGLGHFAVQYARAMGMRVIAIDGGPEKEALCKQLGAEFYIDFKTTKDIPAEVVKITTYGAHGVIVFPATKEGYESAPHMLRPGGRAVAVGLPKDTSVVAGAPPLMMALKKLEFVGSVVGTLKDVEEALDFTARGLVHPILTKGELKDLDHYCQQMIQGKLVGRAVLKV
ncbi:hypothetical protein DV737_g2501, partial [Chaetothyriales sp. CBS 132003]